MNVTFYLFDEKVAYQIVCNYFASRFFTMIS